MFYHLGFIKRGLYLLLQKNWPQWFPGVMYLDQEVRLEGICVSVCLTSLPCMLPTYLNSGMPTWCSLGCWPSISTQSSRPVKQNKCLSSSARSWQLMDWMAHEMYFSVQFRQAPGNPVSHQFMHSFTLSRSPSLFLQHSFLYVMSLNTLIFTQQVSACSKSTRRTEDRKPIH